MESNSNSNFTQLMSSDTHISADSFESTTQIGLYNKLNFVGLYFAYYQGKARQGKDIVVVFRFILEYSSLRDFYRPLLGNNNNNNNNNRSIFII